MRILLLVALLLPSSGRAADFSSNAAGTTAADFLNLGVGGRAMGMGGAYSALANEADALYWNPAALTLIPGKSITLMHAPYFSSSFYDYAAYGQNLGRAGAFGVGFQYFSAGSIAQTDGGGYPTGSSLSPYDLALSFGYAYGGEDWGGFSAGVAGKYVKSQVVGSAQTMAMDWGVLSPLFFQDRLRLALSASNIGGTLRFDAANEPLPVLVKLGSAYRLFDHWTFSLDEDFPRGDNPYTALGVEYLFPMREGFSFAARGGFNTQTLTSITGITGFSMGLGAKFNSCSVDYAFAPYGSVGIAHRLSLSWNWGAVKDRQRRLVMAPAPVIESGADRSGVLIVSLKTGDEKARAEAASQLGELRSGDAVKPLIAALRDDSIAVRGTAADALGKIGDHRALAPLLLLLRDANPKVRALAARALGALGDSQALPVLRTLAKQDPDPRVRKMADAALDQLK